jgi:2-polyprenyl-3-methyl-5-hydroxy-6-metoxy-1,4-benzoquinol methylase
MIETADSQQKKVQIGAVTVNLEYYTGSDAYSDGDIEDEILAIVREKQDIAQLLYTETRWPILCHLSPLRRNLLEWYDFKPSGSVLEIGAGCGALTGLFCEKNAQVTAVELSRRRAEITAYRHSANNNLEIVVGNFNDMKFSQQFDYITLIGVLEYAAHFTNTAQPYIDFLKRIRQLLKPEGVLITAIENKFGLKYWAGAREDHTGKLFEGLEGYLNSDKVATFGKNELTELLAAAGFDIPQYYYPFPDYKLPRQIFSAEQLPKMGQLGGYAPNYDQERLTLFKENLVYDNIIKNQSFDFFANSYLVFCRNRGCV